MSTHQKMFNLHIGMPKTGTKTLQVQLFPEHPEIDFLGTYIWNKKRPRKCKDQKVAEFMTELIWNHLHHPDISRCKELYSSWAAQAAEQNKILLWSWESLMENTHEVQRIRAQNIKEVVGEANITICLRQPVSLIESLYVQLLKRDNIGAYARIGKKHRFEPIEQWLANGWDRDGYPPKAHLEYAESLQVFSDVFGKDSIKVLLFEQLVENQDAYVRNFCEFIGVEPESGIRLAKGPRVNERWGQEQYDRLKELDRSPMRALRFRFSDKVTRMAMLGMKHKRDKGTSKTLVQIPNEWRQRIEDKTRSGNRMIQEQWNVPLEQYGYPV